MDPIYVTGHRNPDTDSIVAAMAYAALRNALGDREYQAACLGRVSDETQTVLNHFGFEPPKLLTNMYTQVRDLDYDTPPLLSKEVTLYRGWDALREVEGTIPVTNEDGTLYGMLSREDVASFNMVQAIAGVLKAVPLFNVLSVLEGKVINEAGESVDTIAGEITIALPQSRENLLFNKKEWIFKGCPSHCPRDMLLGWIRFVRVFCRTEKRCLYSNEISRNKKAPSREQIIGKVLTNRRRSVIM